MKFLTSAATVLALMLAGPVAQAQQVAAPQPAVTPAAKDAKPALWVVKDDDTTIYLFGTIHVLSPKLSWFNHMVKTAFDGSDEMVSELGAAPDPAAAQAVVMKYAMITSGPTLSERLPADKREALAKAMADVGVPAQAYDRFQPWFAAVQLSMIALAKAGFDPGAGVESVLNKAVTDHKKPQSGLETIDEQLSFFANLSQEAQMKFLVSSLDGLTGIEAEFAKMVDTWSAGDAEGIAAIMNEAMDASPELRKILLTDRNARWAQWIEQRMAKPGTVFVAVGAGHLAGPDSVQAALEKRKIASTRVTY